MDDLKNIIESLIFISDGPLTLDQIKNVLPGVDSNQIRRMLDELIKEYETSIRGFYLREIAGGVQFRTRPEYKEYIIALFNNRPPKLSKAGLETLAIIAYKQPVIRADIEHIRGVDCGGVLRMLMERNLVRVLGRREIPGRPLIYATTKKFLEVFDLRNLKDLPTPVEIEDLESDSLEDDEITPKPVTVVKSSPKAVPTKDLADIKEPQYERKVDSDGGNESSLPTKFLKDDSGPKSD